ncbi:MAG: hypothetical protein ABMA64_42025 [Myxococcota bacterium]
MPETAPQPSSAAAEWAPAWGNDAAAHELSGPAPQPEGLLDVAAKRGTGAAATKAPSRVVEVGAARIRVRDDAEAARATEIVTELRDGFQVDVSSPASLEAIQRRYSFFPSELVAKLHARDLEFRELVAVHAALGHFAPILGEARAGSSRADTPQEVSSVGGVNAGMTFDPMNGVAPHIDSGAMGEYFKGPPGNFAMYGSGLNAKFDFGDNAKQLEGTATHELAHGLMRYALDRFMAATGYWADKNTPNGTAGLEAPVTKYGRTNADEDLSEAVMYFFVDRDTLHRKCPIRERFLEQEVAAWTQKPNS